MVLTILASSAAHAAVVSYLLYTGLTKAPEPITIMDVELIYLAAPQAVIQETPQVIPTPIEEITPEPEVVKEVIIEDLVVNVPIAEEPIIEIAEGIISKDVVVDLKPEMAVAPPKPKFEAAAEPVQVAVIEIVIEEPAAEQIAQIEPVTKPVIEPAPQLAALSNQDTMAGEEIDAGSNSDLIVAPDYNLGFLHNAKPKYPKRARKRGLEGKVVLTVLVSASGLVENLSIQSSSGHSVLDKAALKAVKTWRFKSGTFNGLDTAATINIPITFKLEN